MAADDAVPVCAGRSDDLRRHREINRVKAAGIVLGVELGGFVDGILLHMILPWHYMLSNVVPPDTMAGIHTNMTWDGIFHALTWAITLVGIFMLWDVVRIPRATSAVG